MKRQQTFINKTFIQTNLNKHVQFHLRGKLQAIPLDRCANYLTITDVEDVHIFQQFHINCEDYGASVN